MIKTGISIYLGLNDYSLEENIKYLKLAKKVGIDYCFTSAHMPEASNFDDFKKILSVIEELDLKLIIDVSKPMMNNFVLPQNLYALRLDWGFSDDDIVEMSNKFHCKIELNASTLNLEKLKRLISLGINLSNIRVSHNFYPKKHTGLAIEKISEKNKIFHQYGLAVMAYLPSQSGKRAPLYDGLPTVERHRNLTLEIALQELVLSGVDEVFFGDAFASISELKYLVEFENIFTIPIKLYPNITLFEEEILSKKHKMRIDESPLLIRSSLTRGFNVLYKTNFKQPKELDIIIDNEKYLRYQGELGILKQDIPNDERFNIVAYVKPEAKTLLSMIPAGSYFKFRIVKEE